MIEYFIEVPNTNIKEPVEGFAYDLLYDMAQEFGYESYQTFLICFYHFGSLI